jgi:hypothetical protein
MSDGILLTQEKYATDLLHCVGMLSCKPVPTPMSSTKKLTVQSGDSLGPEDVNNYCSVVRALQYLSHTHGLILPLLSIMHASTCRCPRRYIGRPSNEYLGISRTLCWY